MRWYLAIHDAQPIPKFTPPVCGGAAFFVRSDRRPIDGDYTPKGWMHRKMNGQPPHTGELIRCGTCGELIDYSCCTTERFVLMPESWVHPDSVIPGEDTDLLKDHAAVDFRTAIEAAAVRKPASGLLPSTDDPQNPQGPEGQTVENS